MKPFLFFLGTLMVLHSMLLGNQPSTIVIFGATGDLTSRKLLPAIYQLAEKGQLGKDSSIVGFARGQHTHETFRALAKQAIKAKDVAAWQQFESRLFYNRAGYEEDQGYESLKLLLDQDAGHLFYLATPASQFSTIIRKLHQHGLLANPATRVIIEKPFGSDLESAYALNENISLYLNQDRIYLMDHYLGKGPVQNLLPFRFDKAHFEALWNNQSIDHVEITLSEELGIGSRARFWEETGSLRDVFQNHVLQLLALLTMEPPTNSANIHDQKIKVLNAIRPLLAEEIVRGQYGAGQINGLNVPGYKEEADVPPESTAETFVAAKLFIDNPRWNGVPFYLRMGKRMARQTTEIVISFKDHIAYEALLIRIQPRAGIYLKMRNSNELVLVEESPEAPEAYEKLIFDGLQGDHRLYVEAEEQFAAWRLLTPVLDYWKLHPETLEIYPAGTWGPTVTSHHWKLLGE